MEHWARNTNRNLKMKVMPLAFWTRHFASQPQCLLTLSPECSWILVLFPQGLISMYMAFTGLDVLSCIQLEREQVSINKCPSPLDEQWLLWLKRFQANGHGDITDWISLRSLSLPGLYFLNQHFSPSWSPEPFGNENQIEDMKRYSIDQPPWRGTLRLL